MIHLFPKKKYIYKITRGFSFAFFFSKKKKKSFFDDICVDDMDLSQKIYFALNSPLVYYTTDVEKKNNHKDVDSLYDV